MLPFFGYLLTKNGTTIYYCTAELPARFSYVYNTRGLNVISKNLLYDYQILHFATKGKTQDLPLFIFVLWAFYFEYQ